MCVHVVLTTDNHPEALVRGIKKLMVISGVTTTEQLRQSHEKFTGNITYRLLFRLFELKKTILHALDIKKDFVP